MDELSVPTSFQRDSGELERQQGGLWAAPLRSPRPSCLHSAHRQPGSDARTPTTLGAACPSLHARLGLVQPLPPAHLHVQRAISTPAAEGGGLPLRAVTDFEVAAAAGNGSGGDASLRPLDALDGPAAAGQLVLTGQLVPAAQLEAGGPADGGRHPVTTSPLCDWVVDYGGAEPALWAVTQHAWYRLMQPSTRYAPLFASAQRKAALAHAAAADAGAAASPEAAVERAAAAMQAAGDQAAKEFALAQLQVSAASCRLCRGLLDESSMPKASHRAACPCHLPTCHFSRIHPAPRPSLGCRPVLGASEEQQAPHAVGRPKSSG